jgi:perosamine synthetase
MTTGEGGMIVTNNRQIAEICRSERNQGRAENSGWLQHDRLGFNYRLSDIHCALGIAQLERIDELLEGRARVAATYARGLKNVEGVETPGQDKDSKRSWFGYVIQLAADRPQKIRDGVLAALRERGIGCQAYFPPIHEQPYFRALELGPQPALPHTKSAAARCIALPMFSAMSEDQVLEVCDAVRDSVKKYCAVERPETARYAAAGSARA